MIVTSLDTLKLKSQDFTGTEEDLKALVECLEFELKNSRIKGVGLSAIQIGIPERVAIIRYKTEIKVHGERREVETNIDLYNAEVIKQSNPFTFKGEGCLSLPLQWYDTERYNEITIRNGDGKEYKFSGFMAVVIQHEIDHWNGILVSGRT